MALCAAAYCLWWLIAGGSVDAPFVDEYQFRGLYEAAALHRLPAWRELLAAHNSNPYLVLKTILFGALWAHWPWHFFMYAQIPLLAASAGLVIWRMGDQRYTAQQLLAACALIAIFLTARQEENLFWAMQLAFPMYLFFSVLAFTAVDV